MKRSLATLAALLLATLHNFIPPVAAHDHHAEGTTASAAPAAPASSPWGATYFPNVPLVTQDGKTVRFHDDLLKGRKVLINFIFTRCDQACPLDTAKLAQVQQLLGPRVGRDIFMYSITLDPEHDTPAALKAYAEKFGAGPGWLFLTGTRADIDKVRFKLGERRAKEEHANSVRVGDVAKGQWMRLPLTSDANYLVAEVNNTFYPSWSAGKTLVSIDEVPRTTVFGPGEILFRGRCAACHTLGKGDRLGPDLKDVASRRERAWLIRYLAAPDYMRSKKDPIAVALAAKYRVPMPNLRLTRADVANLIEYLEAQIATPPDNGHERAHERKDPVAAH